MQPLAGTEKAFGAALREVRREAGMSQEGLALEAGFERAYVSLIERGLKSPTIRALVRLAEALKVRPSAVVVRMEEHLASTKRQGKKPAK